MRLKWQLSLYLLLTVAMAAGQLQADTAAGQGESGVTVFLIDGTQSMLNNDPQSCRYTMFRMEWGIKVSNHLLQEPPYNAHVIFFGGAAVDITATRPFTTDDNIEQVLRTVTAQRDAIVNDNPQFTWTTRTSEAFQLAYAILKRTHSSNKQIYVFSDMVSDYQRSSTQQELTRFITEDWNLIEEMAADNRSIPVFGFQFRSSSANERSALDLAYSRLERVAATTRGNAWQCNYRGERYCTEVDCYKQIVTGIEKTYLFGELEPIPDQFIVDHNTLRILDPTVDIIVIISELDLRLDNLVNNPYAGGQAGSLSHHNLDDKRWLGTVQSPWGPQIEVSSSQQPALTKEILKRNILVRLADTVEHYWEFAKGMDQSTLEIPQDLISNYILEIKLKPNLPPHSKEIQRKFYTELDVSRVSGSVILPNSKGVVDIPKESIIKITPEVDSQDGDTYRFSFKVGPFKQQGVHTLVLDLYLPDMPQQPYRKYTQAVTVGEPFLTYSISGDDPRDRKRVKEIAAADYFWKSKAAPVECNYGERNYFLIEQRQPVLPYLMPYFDNFTATVNGRSIKPNTKHETPYFSFPLPYESKKPVEYSVVSSGQAMGSSGAKVAIGTEVTFTLDKYVVPGIVKWKIWARKVLCALPWVLAGWYLLFILYRLNRRRLTGGMVGILENSHLSNLETESKVGLLANLKIYRDHVTIYPVPEDRSVLSRFLEKLGFCFGKCFQLWFEPTTGDENQGYRRLPWYNLGGATGNLCLSLRAGRFSGWRVGFADSEGGGADCRKRTVLAINNFAFSRTATEQGYRFWLCVKFKSGEDHRVELTI